MCNCFVILNDYTLDGFTIFGKNSCRPENEPQLIRFFPGKEQDQEKIRCHYIEIPQVDKTNSIILSQPYWQFGAEMGANEYGVVIGKEPVYTKELTNKNGLLGDDLVRLALERGESAEECLNIITNLINTYGQAGIINYEGKEWHHHSAFLIADPNEAHILETAGRWWAAESVKKYRTLSNILTISGKGEKAKDGIIDYAIEKGYIQEEGDFNFSTAFSKSNIDNELPASCDVEISKRFLIDNENDITLKMMMDFLKDPETCNHDRFKTNGSQISQLKEEMRSIHWFTNGQNPRFNIYKPYIFPVKEQKTEKIERKDRIDQDWFWVRHKNFISQFEGKTQYENAQEYLNRLEAFNLKTLDQVREIEHQEDELVKKDFQSKMEDINLDVWKKAYELIT